MGEFEEKVKWISIGICLVVAALVAAGLYHESLVVSKAQLYL